jgi:hypothetical protein
MATPTSNSGIAKYALSRSAMCRPSAVSTHEKSTSASDAAKIASWVAIELGHGTTSQSGR